MKKQYKSSIINNHKNTNILITQPPKLFLDFAPEMKKKKHCGNIK